MKCSVCGINLKPDFNFCPGCGTPVNRKDQFKQVVDESFSRLEDLVRGDTMLRLESLSTRLDSIEEELEHFIAAAPADG